MPWIHFHMDTAGKVKACCSTSITFGQLSGNSNEAAIEKIWNGKSATTFRRKLLEGGFDKRCAVCYNREAAGKSSMRTETLDKFPAMLSTIFDESQLNGQTKMRPVYFDLRFSNVCNLRCRTCWHGASSSWFEEAKIMKNTAGDKAIIKATSNNLKVLKTLLAYSSGPAEIYFAGGEPLLMEEHYEMLTELINNDQTDTFLRYNTNLSILKFREFNLIELWKRFENVKLSISIDATKTLGNYIRKGLRWEKLIANMKLLKESCPHIQFEIAPTISILNVSSFGKMHQFFVDSGLIHIDAIYLNLLDRPRSYNIQILPEDNKKEVGSEIAKNIEWLMENDANQKVISEYKSIIDFLNIKSKPEEFVLFHDYNSKIDQIRGEKYDDFSW